MFERFTERARRVVVLAQEESRRLNHNYIGAEHLLLGLVAEEGGVAARALVSLGIRLDVVREQVEKTLGRGKELPAGHIPFTPEAKKGLEDSLREAIDLGHNYIGTEHLLLALVSERKGVGIQILAKLGADKDAVRQKVIAMLEAAGSSEVSTGPGAPPIEGPICRSCRADLTETTAYRTFTIGEHEGEGELSVIAVYCNRCGVSQGILP
ncbi:MAG: hypothetical protein H0U53_04280 [Actinobacteria bacterium]|nr:hypothetical protein [Actinomycetota bacterium]